MEESEKVLGPKHLSTFLNFTRSEIDHRLRQDELLFGYVRDVLQ
jgi:hypothetical protein